jgi:hypothetical protein
MNDVILAATFQGRQADILAACWYSAIDSTAYYKDQAKPVGHLPKACTKFIGRVTMSNYTFSKFTVAHFLKSYFAEFWNFSKNYLQTHFGGGGACPTGK